MTPDSSFFGPVSAARHAVALSQECHTTRSAVCEELRLLASDISYAELDAHIRDLGRLAEKAMVDGDRHGAHLWAMRMYDAVKSRSLGHQAALHADIDRRIDEGVDYFSWQGKLDAERLAKAE